jgi:hypothetical protein
LTKGDIQRFQRSVTQGETKANAPAAQKRGRVRVRGGAAAAARSTAVLAAMLAWATERGFLSANPAKGVQLNTLAARERFLIDFGRCFGRDGGSRRQPIVLNIIRLLPNRRHFNGLLPWWG